jgi:hypothetical protein
MVEEKINIVPGESVEYWPHRRQNLCLREVPCAHRAPMGMGKSMAGATGSTNLMLIRQRNEKTVGNEKGANRKNLLTP